MHHLLLIFFVGPFFGMLWFLSAARWVGLFFFAYNQLAVLGPPVQKSRLLGLVLCESIFHSGPWFTATVVFIAYEIGSERWATSLFLGFFGGIVYMTIGAVRGWKALRRHTIRDERANAA